MKRIFIAFIYAIMLGEVYAQPSDSLRSVSTVGKTTQELFSFVRNIERFNHNFPQEKVYLHFDNTG
ncbi:MAG: hypothetical protein Q4C43_12135, partial [Prevotella sp.]|nr:hypothetical protein [Prevotella sp.]